MDHHESQPLNDIAGYTPQSRLGSGSFATVYKAILSGPTHSESDLPSVAAIKSIQRSKKLTPKVLANLQTEITILRNHCHPNIVRLFKVSETSDCVYLVLEYCAGGDLQGLIRTRRNGRLNERLCRRLIRDLARGLGFLWERQLVHRDIKPQNLLLTCALPKEDEDENPSKDPLADTPDMDDGGEFMLKIADFGFARHLGGVDLAETMCGSPLYMAPEILLGQKYDAKADLWSVGTVLFEMISGRTPFHGENHMDLLNNIKRKAVRLPPDVRVSKECVTLLRILLDRRPATRADFRSFYEAVEKFVALGCNGPKVQEPLRNGSEEMMPLKAQMDLCAITEDDAGESEDVGKSCSLRPLTTLKPGPNQTNLTKEATSGQDLVQIVTPPFQPTLAPAPPPSIYSGMQVNNIQRQSSKRSIFAPLQASPNLSPATTPVGTFFPNLSLEDGGATLANSKLPSMPIQQRTGANSLMPSENTNITRRDSQHSSSSSREAYDSGFVLVEHSGHRSRSGSLTNSPSNSITRAPPSPGRKYFQEGFSQSPSQSCSRMIVKGATGMLGTSPATGQALVGRMMMGSSNTKSGMSAAPISSGKFNVSPRSALRSGGCLAHIDLLVRMLSAAEDIGRRAIAVAHLGDVRAYLAMRAYAALRDESRSSSSCTPMELEDDHGRLSMRDKLTKNAIVEEDEEDDELPFAMTTSMDDGSIDGMSQSPVLGNIMTNLAPVINENNKHSESTPDKVEDFSALVRIHFHEALLCYMKTLTMLRSAICAGQKILKDVEEVIRVPPSRSSQNSNNPYIPLQKRCAGSLKWLGKSYKAIVERSDAASDEISVIEKNTSSQTDIKSSLLLVEELIFNHCLKCGSEGTIKQTLGHYDEARECYRSAGLLAETLLMDPKVRDEDRAILEGYVHSFMDQIMDIDGLIRTSRSRASIVNESSVSVLRRQISSPSKSAV